MPEVIVTANGTLRWIHDESSPRPRFGQGSIRRASHVEPESPERWFADLSPVGGPCLGPFHARSLAIAAEIDWLGQRLASLP
ncbi:MAG: hypothetical protein KC561_13125, partial [Myxococcales bacterium]|nr:hypothetical protein [Myxococcales bacterium]